MIWNNSPFYELSLNFIKIWFQIIFQKMSDNPVNFFNFPKRTTYIKNFNYNLKSLIFKHKYVQAFNYVVIHFFFVWTKCRQNYES